MTSTGAEKMVTDATPLSDSDFALACEILKSWTDPDKPLSITRLTYSRMIATITALKANQRTVLEERERCACIAEEFWGRHDDPGNDPTDEPGAGVRRDAGLSIAAAIRSAKTEG